MSEKLGAAAASSASQRPEWQDALDTLERALREASQAVALLRQGLEGYPAHGDAASAPAMAGPEPTPIGSMTAASTPSLAQPIEEPAAAREPAAFSTFDRLWDRLERERMERQAETAPAASADPLTPGQLQLYLMTVEDREGKVDLVSLHRSLASLPGMEEVSLVTYANGVPVVSLRVGGELDLDRLGHAVSTAMDRQCEVIPQDRGKIYLRLKAS